VNKPPNKQNSVIKPIQQEEIYPGLIGFDSAFQTCVQYHASLEKLNTVIGEKSPTSDIVITEGGAPKTTTIYKKNDAYYVYFHVSELTSDWGANLTSFTLWLLTLSVKDVVYIHQTGDAWNLTGIINILDTLGTECKARKIFVIDHPIENALFSLVCDDVIITEFGALTFSNGMNIDPTRWDKVFTPYLKSVYAKAVERKYITQEEVNSIFNDNTIIFKTAKDLRAQGITVV
jgi:hypothetical protein